ncbi:MAG: hypothetical protein WCJ35_02790 [Planctomycetota bacterium]
MDGHVARLSLPGLSLAFDADHPVKGIAKITVLDRPWSKGRLMGIAGSVQFAAATTLTDWHVRGDDLIAVYEMGQPDAARVDLLWHVAHPAAEDPWIVRVELLVSVCTDRLDWRPDVCLESVLPEVTVVEKFDLLGNLFAAQGWSLAVMVHPADLGHRALTAEAETSATYHLRHPLFQTECLEKGVILRARARAWFLPCDVERVAVSACFTEFIAADPPLSSRIES